MEVVVAKMKRVILYVSPKDYVELKIKLLRQNTNVSAWFRKVVKGFLREKDPTNPEIAE